MNRQFDLNSEMKTVKAGGTSTANAGKIRNVAAVITCDPTVKAFIISAPGKDEYNEIGVTDMLHLVAKNMNQETKWIPLWKAVSKRFETMIVDLGLENELGDLLENTFTSIKENFYKDFILARGENLNATIITAYLNSIGHEAHFVDTIKCIFFLPNGLVDEERTYSAIQTITPETGIAIFPGYYGINEAGEIQVFDRGGSDLSAALICAALSCTIFKKMTDVKGMLRANPKYVPYAQPISKTDYRKAKILAGNGAKVIHEDTFLYLRKHNITIYICDANDPENAGTIIYPMSENDDRGNNGKVIGIAEQDNVIFIETAKIEAHDTVGYGAKIFQTLSEMKISYTTEMPGFDQTPVIISIPSLLKGLPKADNKKEEEKQISDRIFDLETNLKIKADPDSIKITRNLAFITILSEDYHTLTDILQVLERIRVIPHASVSVSGQIFILIPREETAKTVKAIHDRFFPSN